MKTFALQVSVGLRIAVSAEMLTSLRAEASFPPSTGGDVFLHQLDKSAGDDDEAFLQGVLSNGLRKLIGASLKTDLRTMGVQATVEPAVVTATLLKPPEKAPKKAAAVIVGRGKAFSPAGTVIDVIGPFTDETIVAGNTGPRVHSKVYQDGAGFCAVGADFINLQESISGHGATPEEAIADYEASANVIVND